MLTLLLIGLPLFACILLFAVKTPAARNLAMVFSLLEFLLAIFAWFLFRNNPESSLLHINLTWVQSLNIHVNLSISALSLLMVLLTCFLVPLIVLSSFQSNYQNSNSFYALIALMQMALVGVFMANDGFLFYVFWELALIPIYFICLLWGGENRAKLLLNFFVYTLFGSLLMLIGLIYFYNHTA